MESMPWEYQYFSKLGISDAAGAFWICYIGILVPIFLGGLLNRPLAYVISGVWGLVVGVFSYTIGSSDAGSAILLLTPGVYVVAAHIFAKRRGNRPKS